jgi:hypothetical protein
MMVTSVTIVGDQFALTPDAKALVAHLKKCANPATLKQPPTQVANHGSHSRPLTELACHRRPRPGPSRAKSHVYGAVTSAIFVYAETPWKLYVANR